MGLGAKHIKTNHNGAKNGGGYWGKRAEAKAVSSKARRLADKTDILEKKEEN